MSLDGSTVLPLSFNNTSPIYNQIPDDPIPSAQPLRGYADDQHYALIQNEVHPNENVVNNAYPKLEPYMSLLLPADHCRINNARLNETGHQPRDSTPPSIEINKISEPKLPSFEVAELRVGQVSAFAKLQTATFFEEPKPIVQSIVGQLSLSLQDPNLYMPVINSPIFRPFGFPTEEEKTHREERVRHRRTTTAGPFEEVERTEFQQVQDHEEDDRFRQFVEGPPTEMSSIQQRLRATQSDHITRLWNSRGETNPSIASIHRDISLLEHQNLNDLSFLAPISLLPAELLTEVLIIAVLEYNDSPLYLMHVCQSWRVLLLNTSRVWSKIILRTWTLPEKVEFLLERSKHAPLDIIIDTEADSAMIIGDVGLPYTALSMAARHLTRWRSLKVVSFPGEMDLIDPMDPSARLVRFEGTMDRLEVLYIAGPYEETPSLDKLVDCARNARKPNLRDLEISNSNALYRIIRPPPIRILRNLVTFKVHLHDTEAPIDILSHFERLEILEAHRLSIPLYSHTTDLPFVRTIKRMYMKNVSVQWMVGRTFPKLVDCTIIWPHSSETLLSQENIKLPICTNFTYDDHNLQPLTAFDLPIVDKLVIRNEAWNKPRGSRQVGFVWSASADTQAVREPFQPRALHLDTQCFDQSLIVALKMLPQLEELILGLVRPDALGKKFFLAMMAKKGRDVGNIAGNNIHRNTGTRNRAAGWMATLCPQLRVFGVRYRRWLRGADPDELTPLFNKIIETREKTEVPLISFKFWPTKEAIDEEAQELVRNNH